MLIHSTIRAHGRVTVAVTVLLLALAGCGGADERSDGAPATSDSPVVERGHIDLSNYSFPEDGPVNLRGTWGFVWQQFISPAEVDRLDSDPSAGAPAVPGAWNSFEVDGEPIGGTGHATYHLRVSLPSDQVNREMAIKVPDIGTAFRLFVNETPVLEGGTPAPEPEHAEPGYRPETVRFTPHEQELSIVFHVANYDYARGGMWEPIHIGDAAGVERMSRQMFGFDLFVVGALTIMGLYHIGLYLLRREDVSPLLFALYAVFIGVRSIFRGEMFVYTILPAFPLAWHVRLEYITFYAAVPVFYWFLTTVFSLEDRRDQNVVRVVLTAITILFIVPVLVTGPEFFTRFVNYFQLLTVFAALHAIVRVLYPAAKRQLDGSYLAGISFLIFFATIVNDILRMNLVIETPELATVGFLLFTFSQAVMLSQRFSRAYNNIALLSEDLSALNAANARFVPESFLSLLNRPRITDVKLGDSVEREMTILFSDIRDFTEISEHMSPEDNFEFINRYLRRVGPAVREHYGFVDKYVGDGIMALFPRDTQDALDAAVHMQRTIYGMRDSETGDPLRAGIGVHRGRLRLGTIGEEQRIDVTVISSAVNLASRLEQLTRTFGVDIIISEAAYSAVDRERYEVRRLGAVSVKGITEKVPIYEILDGYPEEMRRDLIAGREEFERAVDVLQSGEREKALELFRSLRTQYPDDQCVRSYLEMMGRRRTDRVGKRSNETRN